MSTLDSETLDALNALLEDTRASVEIEVALADGATELREQETLTAMGGDEVLACCALRERLTFAGAPVTWRIGGIVFHILSTERYDERLRAFARHQGAICERAHALLATVTDHPTHRLLQDLYDTHMRFARWAEERSSQFAATRLLDFTVSASVRTAVARMLADGPAPTASASSPLGTDSETSDTTLEAGNSSTEAPEQETTTAREPAQHNGHALPESPNSATLGEALHDGEHTAEHNGASRQELRAHGEDDPLSGD